ncbi:hypothetical protein IM538_04090 [Cytobacillus suaedae]|nr:hypothetical protein IM538_04090 [Cytobacillus suaedae]
MVKKILFYLLTIAFISSCSQQNVTNITLKELVAVMNEQGLELEKTDLPSENVFIQELNGVTPSAYFIDGATLSIYLFSTVDAREKGMDDYKEKLDAASYEQHKTFTVKNVLILYVEGSEENHKKLDKVVDALRK